MARDQIRRRRALALAAGHEPAQHARVQVGVLHAEHDEPSRLHDRRDGLGKGQRAAVSIADGAEGGQEHDALGLAAQRLDEAIDAAGGHEPGTDVWLVRKLGADVAPDGGEGLGIIADHQDVVHARVEPSHQRQVGGDFLVLEDAGDPVRVQSRPDGVVVDTREEHRRARKDLRQVRQRKTQGVVVADIDGARSVTGVLAGQVRGHGARGCRGVRDALGIEVLDAQVRGIEAGGAKGVGEAFVLAPGPGVFLTVGVEHEHRCCARRLGARRRVGAAGDERREYRRECQCHAPDAPSRTRASGHEPWHAESVFGGHG